MRLKNSNGFTLLELLIGVAVIAGGGLAVVGVSNLIVKSTGDLTSQGAVRNFALQLESSAQNPENWNQIVSHNSGMSCLQSGGDCSALRLQPPQALDLYDSSGAVVYRSSDSTTGFNSDGEICNSFSENSVDCPFRYNVEWTPVCPTSGACTNPLISVRGRLETSNSAKNIMLGRTDFAVLRAVASNTSQRSCGAIGGVFDPQNKKCDMPQVSETCGDDRMVVGVDSSRRLICKPTHSGMCANGEILVGYDPATAAPRCRPILSQIPMLNPDRRPIQCSAFNKTEGETWFALSGKTAESVQCEGITPPSYRQQLHELHVEMICKDGMIAPTGRKRLDATNSYLGVCEERPVCPSVGILTWVDRGDITESFDCYGIADLRRNAIYRVEEQMVCSGNGLMTNDRTRKTLISRESCPTVTVDNSISRQIEGTPTAPAGKIIFVVDNSSSMRNAQEQLRTNLDGLLNRFTAQDLTVRVINTTMPGTNVLYPSSQSSFEQATSYEPIGGTTDLARTDIYQLKTGNTFRLTRSSTPQQIAAFRTSIKNAIVAQGTSGSSSEEGLCAALAALNDTGPNRIVESGDVIGMVFLTDDEDSSSWGRPVGNFKPCRNFTKSRIRRETQDVYTYARFYAFMHYTTITDGVETTGGASAEIADPTGLVNNQNCTAAQIAAVKANYPGVAADKWQEFEPGRPCMIRRGNASVSLQTSNDNYCSAPFTLWGRSYANISDYAARLTPPRGMIPGTCTKQPNVVSENVISTLELKMTGENSTTFYDQPITQRLVERFNRISDSGNVFVTNIVNRDAAQCAYNAGQSTSSKYLDLANRIENQAPGHTQNIQICSASYETGLERMASGILQALSNVFVEVNLASNESVAGVTVIRSGSPISLNQQQYTVDGNRVLITGFDIFGGDRISVDVRTTISE